MIATSCRLLHPLGCIRLCRPNWADWIAQVYGQEKPSMKVLTSLRGLSVGCPVRSTSSLLSRNMAKNVQMDDRDSVQFAGLLGKLVGVGQIPVDKSQNEPKITFFNRAKELQNTASSSMSLPALQEMQKIHEDSDSGIVHEDIGIARVGIAWPFDCSSADYCRALSWPCIAQPSRDCDRACACASKCGPKSLEDFEKEAMLLLQARAKKPRTEAKVEKAAEGKQIVGKRVRGKQADSNFHATTAKKAKQPPAKKPHNAEQKTKKTTGGCLRCRGSQNGCDTCLAANFAGQKFANRSAWKEFMMRTRQRLN